MTTIPTLKYHAKERICERFNVKPGGEQAFVDRHFPKAERVVDIVNERGNPCAHYVTGNIIFVVDEKNNEIITMKTKNKWFGSSPQLIEKLRAFIKSEIDGIKLTGIQREELSELLKHEIVTELAKRYAELKRARSIPKQLALKARIAALEERFGEIPSDIKTVRAETRREINGALAHY